jgi:calcineurin-like phosphoesterase family protein
MKKVLKFNSALQKLWFVSDLHYFHGKEFILGPRKYATLDEAKSDLLAKWKSMIGPDDIVFNLGDLIVGAADRTREAMYDILALPCAKHYYLWGNHSAGVNDLYTHSLENQGYSSDIEVYPLDVTGYNFTYVGNYLEIEVDGQPVVMSHYPIASWNHVGKGAFHLHGHCHRNLKDWYWKKRPV